MHNVKTVMVGSVATGKSTMVLMTLQNIFRETQSTAGAMYHKKTIRVHDQDVLLSIWDTAGQEKYWSMARMYYRNANVFILVFDLTRPETLRDCTQWLAMIEESCTEEHHCVILVGNKLDLRQGNEMSDAGSKFAQEHGLIYIETSCKTGVGVDQVFEAAATFSLQENLSHSAAKDPKSINTLYINGGNDRGEKKERKCC